MTCKNCECETTEPLLTEKDVKSCIQNVSEHEKDIGAIEEFLLEMFPNELGNHYTCRSWAESQKFKRELQYRIDESISILKSVGYTVIKSGEKDEQV